MIRPLVERDREEVMDSLRCTGNFNSAEVEFAAEVITEIRGTCPDIVSATKE